MPPTPSCEQARPLRDNAYKVAARTQHARAHPRWSWRRERRRCARSARRSTASRAARRSRARRSTPRVRARRRRLRARSCSRRSRRARSARSTPTPALALPGVARGPHGTRTRRAAHADGELSVLQSAASPTAARSSPRSSPRARGGRAGAPASCTSTTTSSDARRRAARRPSRALQARRRSTRASRPTPSEGDVEAALAAAEVDGRRDLHDAGRAQQPDGAARDDRRLGATAASRSTTRPRARRASRQTIAEAFGLEPEQVRVIVAARRRRLRLEGHAAPARRRWPRWRRSTSAGRSSSRSTRQQMFTLTGYRTPTIQRLRLGADADGRAHGDRPRRRRADVDASRSSPSRPRS